MEVMMRRAITLTEVLVVLAFVLVLMAILLPAIQHVRVLAKLMASHNNLRQISIATANYSANLDGWLPPLAPKDASDPLFLALLPYLEQHRLYDWFHGRVIIDDENLQDFLKNPVNMLLDTYLNPLDPTVANARAWAAKYTITGMEITSYACNAQVFDGLPHVDKVRDGLSNTIFFSEHYAYQCGPVSFFYRHTSPEPRLTGGGFARPSFADGGPRVGKGKNCGDYYPITTGYPPVSTAEDGVTFQLAPAPADADPRQLNASVPWGLQVAMGDGSVRMISGRVSPEAFWGAVTPHGNELTALD
jgi:type II secretory pathway pseudopilin PulG